MKHLLLTAPLRVLSDENHWVRGMQCIRMELGEPDSSSRRSPVPAEGSEFIMEVDTVVVAIGNKPNPLVLQTTPEIKVSKWETILAEKQTMQTSIPAV